VTAFCGCALAELAGLVSHAPLPNSSNLAARTHCALASFTRVRAWNAADEGGTEAAAEAMEAAVMEPTTEAAVKAAAVY